MQDYHKKHPFGGICMWLFRRRQEKNENEDVQNQENIVNFDVSILRQNNITRLSLDERWTKLFLSIKMSPEIEKAEKEMNELIKREAMLKNEQENLEPAKRKLMGEIMSLTQEAFDKDNDEAKKRLAECKKEIEKINKRMNDVLEDIEKVEQELKEANLKLLNDSMGYIFATLKKNRDRAEEIARELIELEQRQAQLKNELEAISMDWTNYAKEVTELIGTDQVKLLEEKFGLEGFKYETSDTSADEDD